MGDGTSYEFASNMKECIITKRDDKIGLEFLPKDLVFDEWIKEKGRKGYDASEFYNIWEGENLGAVVRINRELMGNLADGNSFLYKIHVRVDCPAGSSDESRDIPSGLRQALEDGKFTKIK